MSTDSATPPSTAELTAWLRLSLRWLVVAAGLVAVAVALLIAVRPSTAALLPMEAIVGVLGSDYVVVAVLGVLAVGCAGIALVVRVRRGVTEATPPVVEGVQSAISPGAAVDRTAGRSLMADNAAVDLRERLRDAAIAATIAATDCSRADARRQVDEGSWTTDQVASAWLAADAADGEPASDDNRSAVDDDSAADDATADNRSVATPSTGGDPSAPSKRTLSRTISAITAAAQATDRADSRGRASTEEER
mgnify:CR=1 FL=1